MNKNTTENSFFARKNVVRWAPAVLALIVAHAIFGWDGGPSGIIQRAAPITIGLLYSICFLWFGHFLGPRVSSPMRLIIVAATALVSVSIGFIATIYLFSADFAAELTRFAPGQIGFNLVLFFTILLSAIGMLLRGAR